MTIPWTQGPKASLRVWPSEGDEEGLLRRVFEECLYQHQPGGLDALTEHLDSSRCWFFSLFPAQRTLLPVGSSRILSHTREGTP